MKVVLEQFDGVRNEFNNRSIKNKSLAETLMTEEIMLT